jgi:hypothetical protein
MRARAFSRFDPAALHEKRWTGGDFFPSLRE